MRRKWLLSEAYSGEGVMVALWPSPAIAKHLHAFARSLGVGSLEAVDDIHLTLGFLGTTAELDAATLEGLSWRLMEFAKRKYPLSGLLAGMGRFSASKTSGGKDVMWASADVPALPAFRNSLVQVLDAAGTPARTDHGFTPHLTLTYLEPETKVVLPHFEPLLVKFDTLVLATGGKRSIYKLAQVPAAYTDK